MEIVNFIKSHPNDWEVRLINKPYFLKISRDSGYIMFKYNQIESDFSIPLVREARGIIFRERDWKCVCHPFDKFGNYGESYCPCIDWSTASVQQKIDGSLIKLWYDDFQWHISTNGTINARNAHLDNVKYQNFKELFIAAVNEQFLSFEAFTYHLDENCTYMFELVSPYNRVVINYSELDFYFLGLRDMSTDWEYRPNLSKIFHMPKTYPLHSLDEVVSAAKELSWNDEGYVVCDGNYNRVKIKSPAYVLAHYTRNNNAITAKRLIEVILSGETEEFLTYASEYAEEIKTLEEKFSEISFIAAVNRICYSSYFNYNRKEYAEMVKKGEKRFQPYLFALYEYHDLKFKDFTKEWNSTKWEAFINADNGKN